MFVGTYSMPVGRLIEIGYSSPIRISDVARRDVALQAAYQWRDTTTALPDNAG